MSASLGVLSSLAFAPWYALWAMVLALSGILRLLDHPGWSPKMIRGLACLFGLGHWIMGLFWVSNSLSVDWERFFWLLPLTALGIPIVLTPFVAVPLIAARRFYPAGVARALACTVFLILAELLRSQPWCLHFPWNLWGHAGFAWPALSQMASVLGGHGLGLILLLLATTPYVLSYRPQRTTWIASVVASLAGLLVWGTWHMAQPTQLNLTKDRFGQDHPVRVRLVQPNIRQDEKWSPAQARAHFNRLLRLSTPTRSLISEPTARLSPDVIVWPEAALPWYPRMITEDPSRRIQIAALLMPGAFVISGANRAEQLWPERPRYYNSLVAIDAQGRVAGHYDKKILLPFGEYIPFRRWIEALLPFVHLQKMAEGMLDFDPGQGSSQLVLPNLPVACPMICSETLHARDELLNATWGVAVSNDGWFGQSPGPHQHLAATRMRALESGRPIVHSGNTGITAVINARGQIVASLRLGEEGTLEAELPGYTQTYCAMFGHKLLFALLTVLMGVLAYVRRRHAQPHPR